MLRRRKTAGSVSFQCRFPCTTAFCGDGDESNSNFIQLLKLRGLDDPRIGVWISKKADKYTSHDIMDKLLKAMALCALQKISANFAEAYFFSIMCNECTNTANREHLVSDGLILI